MRLEVNEMQELKEKLFEHLKNEAIDISFRAAGLLVDIAKIDIRPSETVVDGIK